MRLKIVFLRDPQRGKRLFPVIFNEIYHKRECTCEHKKNIFLGSHSRDCDMNVKRFGHVQQHAFPYFSNNTPQLPYRTKGLVGLITSFKHFES